MKIKRKLLIAAALATAAPTGLMSQGAWAQDLEEIVVTGSYIKRNREELSTPVDVYDRSEFEAAGSPTAVDIIQNMPAVSGTVNRSEQFGNGGTIIGLKMVNIRGLGMGRTLVLMNGKRIVNNGSGTNAGEFPVDIGNFPNIALQRIELLKSGGSTTYGTDAIAGTFNFITRDEFEGFEVRASKQFIDGSDGDDELAAIWGIAEGSLNLVTSVEYSQKARLSNTDVGDQYYGGIADGGWPLGISTFGNPGTFFGTVHPGAAGIDPIWFASYLGDQDPACGYTNGEGAHSFDPNPAVPSNLLIAEYSDCGYNYVPFSNVIDPQKRLKVLSQLKLDVSDNMQFYGEVLISRLESSYYGSPSYPPTNPDAGYFTYIHPDNPGLVDLVAGIDPARAPFYAGGAIWWGRSLATEGPSYVANGIHETNRYVAGIRGELPYAETISYDVSINYSTEDNRSDHRGGKDILTNRFNAATSGLGGEFCEPANPNDFSDPANDVMRGDAAASCYWFNPAGSSIGAAPGDPLYNDPEIREWFTGETSGTTHQNLLVLDAVLSGESFELPAGTISWAAGAQWRYWSRMYVPTGDNRVDSATSPVPFHFLGTNLKSQIETRNYGVFGEASIPIIEGLNVDVGVRYEDYGLGNVTRPKISARYDIMPELAIRASFEQVFRTPVVGSQATRSLELVGAEYVTIETPVPTGLKPEEGDSINVGLIGNWEGFSGSVDYFMLNMDGPFARESVGSADVDIILAPDGITILKIIAERINGDSVEVAGLDFQGKYQWMMDDYDFEVGLTGILNTKYDVEKSDGTMYDALGKFNFRSTDSPINVRSVPELKLNASAAVRTGPHYLGLFARYISSYDMDVSSSDFGKVALGLPFTVDESLTFDVHYSLSLLDEATQLSASVINIADEDAPAAPHEIGYDGGTHSPLGRVIRLSIRHQF